MPPQGLYIQFSHNNYILSWEAIKCGYAKCCLTQLQLDNLLELLAVAPWRTIHATSGCLCMHSSVKSGRKTQQAAPRSTYSVAKQTSASTNPEAERHVIKLFATSQATSSVPGDVHCLVVQINHQKHPSIDIPESQIITGSKRSYGMQQFKRE
jgi:hypothetical protein